MTATLAATSRLLTFLSLTHEWHIQLFAQSRQSHGEKAVLRWPKIQKAKKYVKPECASENFDEGSTLRFCNYCTL